MNNAQGVAIRMEIKQQIENIQTAIRIMGQEIEKIKRKIERDQKDTWKIIHDITENIKCLK